MTRLLRRLMGDGWPDTRPRRRDRLALWCCELVTRVTGAER